VMLSLADLFVDTTENHASVGTEASYSSPAVRRCPWHALIDGSDGLTVIEPDRLFGRSSLKMFDPIFEHLLDNEVSLVAYCIASELVGNALHSTMANLLGVMLQAFKVTGAVFNSLLTSGDKLVGAFLQSFLNVFLSHLRLCRLGRFSRSGVDDRLLMGIILKSLDVVLDHLISHFVSL